MGENKRSDETSKSIIETAKKRFELGRDADSENREKAIEDMEFRAGNQWPEDIKNNRSLDNRPCLTINKIPQNVHQITNEQRQNRPAIKVSPFDDVADPETAEILQGLCRSIENISNADTAYDMGFDSAVTGGRGYVRIITEYASHESFDQDIKIKSVHDPHSVILDPNYREPDGSDANWGFIFDDIPIDEFKEQYPDAEICKDGFSVTDKSDWMGEDKVRVAEYFSKEFKKDKLIELPDGSTALKSDIDKMEDVELEELGVNEEILKGLKSRDTLVPFVKWYKINGEEILEETEWPSQWIGIVPIHGEELWVNGKRVFEGIVRHAKDPQRMYNYWATCETEAIALAPKTPFIGVEGQFEGHEHKWNTAHLKNYSFLEYKPTTLGNGQQAPPPQKQHNEANVQAITQARMLSSDDLKSTTGIYDASLGNRSNESSGIAIRSRTSQTQTGNFHFVDNLSRSIRHIGRIIVDLAPKIYDTKRVIRILGEDDEQSIVTINSIFQDKDGKKKKFDLGRGKYDVTTTSGPSFASKRQEAVESMLSMSQHNPQITQLAGDLLIKNMDWPGSQEIAERIRKTIPPEVLGEDNVALPPQIKAQMDQQMQMIEQLTKDLEDATDINEGKVLELKSKERIETMKVEADIRIKLAELEVKQAEMAARYGAKENTFNNLENEATELDDRQDLIGFDEEIETQDQLAEQLENEMNAEGAQNNTNLTGEMPPGQNVGQAPIGEI